MSIGWENQEKLLKSDFWAYTTSFFVVITPHFYQQLADVTCDVQCLIMWYFILQIFVV